jgi:enoyl-CoA hydratase/carnithine racemase
MTLDPNEHGGASLQIDDGVATILFNRMQTRNAMLQATWRALPLLIAKADADPMVDAIMLRGAGGHFGAGNDISEFGVLRDDNSKCRQYGQDMADAMMAVETASKPVIAAIEGNCFGASVALALAADFRIAAADARIAIPPAKLGALYLRSDLHRLVAAIGQGQARRMIFTATPIVAAEAHTIGLVEKMAAPDDFEAELKTILQAIQHGSPYSLRHSKRLFGLVHGDKTPAEDDESLGWFVDAMQGADFAEGFAAFMEKRKPDFRKN